MAGLLNTLGAVGSAINPVIGPAIGAAEFLSSVIKKRQANALAPKEEDLEQRQMLNELNRKRLQMERGAGAAAQTGRGLIGRGLAQSQQNILRTGMGPGATLQGLAMAQRQAGDATNQYLADLQKQAGQYQQMAINLQNQMAQRKFGVQTSRYLQKLREASELRKSGLSNIQEGLARMFPATPNTEVQIPPMNDTSTNTQVQIPPMNDTSTNTQEPDLSWRTI